MPSPYSDITGGLLARGAVRARAEITRAANTTAYAAGDIINGSGLTVPIPLDIARQASGHGEIVQVVLETDLATITNGDIRVHFFKESHTLAADNAAFASLHANRANYLGFVTLPTLIAMGGGAAAKDDDLRIPFESSSSDGKIYAVLEALGAYTPASGQVISLSIAAVLYD